ncbi:hypothetical protein C8F01DRAFT_1156060 [Mycena amicta]|nr:hypothetical protein C8F01DRAFT_1156060 [Mycena amicta]
MVERAPYLAHRLLGRSTEVKPFDTGRYGCQWVGWMKTRLASHCRSFAQVSTGRRVRQRQVQELRGARYVRLYGRIRRSDGRGRLSLLLVPLHLSMGEGHDHHHRQSRLGRPELGVGTTRREERKGKVGGKRKRTSQTVGEPTYTLCAKPAWRKTPGDPGRWSGRGRVDQG